MSMGREQAQRAAGGIAHVGGARLPERVGQRGQYLRLLLRRLSERGGGAQPVGRDQRLGALDDRRVLQHQRLRLEDARLVRRSARRNRRRQRAALLRRRRQRLAQRAPLLFRFAHRGGGRDGGRRAGLIDQRGASDGSRRGGDTRQ